MSHEFNDFAGDCAHGCASRAVESHDAPLPFSDWAELGRQILAEAARRAIAESASPLARVGRDIEQGGRVAMISEDRA